MEIPKMLNTLGWFVLSYFIVNDVSAHVVIRTKNESEPLTDLVDLMAAFGPDIPDNGITGFVHPVVPSDACREVQPPPDNMSTWIALIARDNCTFVEKVRNVATAGYAIAIVYNRRDDNTRVHMQGDGKGVKIPSVFVGWSDGQILATQYCYFCTEIATEYGNYVVTVDNEEPKIFQYNAFMLPFAVVIGTCFVLMIVFMVVKGCRDIRRKRKSRLTVKHLKKIPTSKFKKGDDYDVCAICLDDYAEGDKLRILPCNHVYHCKCVDPWLTKSKRSCPICKRKVIPGDDADSDDSDSDGGEEASTSTERTPLLRSGNNNTRRSTFDNSGLPEPSHPALSINNDAEPSSNPLLSIPRSSAEQLANESNEETVVIETSQEGPDNSGFVVGEDEEMDGSDYGRDDDPAVLFVDSDIKDEKKNNHVV